MTRSQNGWPVLPRASDTTTFSAGGRQWRAAGALVAEVATEFINAYAAEVEPITGGELDDWSWAVRTVRDSATVISNHASATAWDINALDHARGVRGSFAASQLRALDGLLRDFPVIRWGGSYGPTSVVDEMHFEVNVSPAGLDAWCHTGALTAQQYIPSAGITHHPAAIAPLTIAQEDDLTPEQATMLTDVHRELTQRLPNRVDGTSSDTLLGYALDADRNSHLVLQLLTAAYPSAVTGSTVRLSPVDLWRNADANAYQLVQIVAGQKAAIDMLAAAVAKNSPVSATDLRAVVTDAMKNVVQVHVTTELKG